MHACTDTRDVIKKQEYLGVKANNVVFLSDKSSD